MLVQNIPLSYNVHKGQPGYKQPLISLSQYKWSLNSNQVKNRTWTLFNEHVGSFLCVNKGSALCCPPRLFRPLQLAVIIGCSLLNGNHLYSFPQHIYLIFFSCHQFLNGFVTLMYLSMRMAPFCHRTSYLEIIYWLLSNWLWPQV